MAVAERVEHTGSMSLLLPTRIVSAATRPALDELVAFWEGRKWRRTAGPAVEVPGRRRSPVWNQEMELTEEPPATRGSETRGRRAGSWFD